MPFPANFGGRNIRRVLDFVEKYLKYAVLFYWVVMLLDATSFCYLLPVVVVCGGDGDGENEAANQCTPRHLSKTFSKKLPVLHM